MHTYVRTRTHAPQTNHKGVEVVHDVVSQLQDYDMLGGKKLSAKESSQIATEVCTYPLLAALTAACCLPPLLLCALEQVA